MLRPAMTRRRKWLIRVGVALPVCGVALWLAVHNIPGFGPFMADSLRWAFGNEFVAWLEDTAYGAEDWVNQKTRAEESAEPMWEVPETPPSSIPAEPSASGEPPPPAFTLANLAPMVPDVATTKGEGIWVPVVDPRHPGDRTRLLKTFIHPDKNRSWAVVAIVAVDLSSVELHAVAGRHEPERKSKDAKAYQVPAIVPPEMHDRLIAAFNGGYKSTHGEYGMKIGGVVLAPPRARCCVVALMNDGRYLIRDWDSVKDREPEMTWWRQTPMCMFDEGTPHPMLSAPKFGWGAASVSGTTVIRRSAIGLDKDKKLLFIGIGDHVTGQAIGMAMHHAGAHSVSQLDVNFSFPKFVLYDYKQAGDKELKAIPLTEHFEYTEDQYVGKQAERDFFYLARR
jgi:hypothetical protein